MGYKPGLSVREKKKFSHKIEEILFVKNTVVEGNDS